MTDENLKNKNLNSQSPPSQSADGLDEAGRSLAEALKISFAVLKIIMVVLVFIFLFSGLKTVEPGERALVMRFGKIRAVVGPGLHWVFPYPIDRLVRIPVERKVNLPIDSLWYFETMDDVLASQAGRNTRPPRELNPTREGYCLTRSAKSLQDTDDPDGSDYNIVHSKWQLIYQIKDPELFFRNVFVRDVTPGQIYFDVVQESIKPLLVGLIEHAVVTSMVNYTIDEALVSQERIPRQVATLLQQKLDRIDSGIEVVSVQLTDIIWPRQVDQAFEALHSASQASGKVVTEAKLSSDTILIEAQAMEQDILAEAGGYRTTVVESARASADYLENILPQYKQRPRLVMQSIYLDALEYIFDRADEKFIVQPGRGAQGDEIRVHINRDPTLKPRPEDQAGQTDQQP
jgi:membrane protease subunit HflK